MFGDGANAVSAGSAPWLVNVQADSPNPIRDAMLTAFENDVTAFRTLHTL